MIDENLSALDTIFEALPSGLMIFDDMETIIKVNTRAQEILGLPENKPLTTIRDFPDNLVELRLLLTNTQTDITRAEINLLLPQYKEAGTIGFTLKNIQLNHDDGPSNGRENGSIKIFIFSDITDVQKDRLAMDKIKEELYQSRKLASIGTMISGIAHELNNPLTGISMSCDLSRMSLERLKKTLAEQAETGDAEAFEKTRSLLDKTLGELDKINLANKKASALVGDLLNYSKPTQLNLSVENPLKLLEDTIQAIKSHPEFSGVIFKTASLNEATSILCDKVKLEQVFYNLFKNASDAMAGQGTIRIGIDRSSQLSSSNNKEKKHLTIHISDTGPGIDKTIMARIFDPFFTTKGSKGVGLGLSISYRTVEQHGGQLSVDSEPGKGTTFHIMLPEFEEDANDPDLF